MERVTRARADDDVGRVESLDLLQSDLVITVDDEIGASLGEELNDVVGEAVVVVDQHGLALCIARAGADGLRLNIGGDRDESFRRERHGETWKSALDSMPASEGERASKQASKQARLYAKEN